MRLRLATFNVENLDIGGSPSLAERIAVMRPMLRRIDADVLCLQEVHAQERGGDERALLALGEVLDGTPYAGFQRAVTHVSGDERPLMKRNLVVLSRWDIERVRQHRHDLGVSAPEYRILSSVEEEEVRTSDRGPVQRITWERPLLYVQIRLPDGRLLHVVNLHLKSRNPTAIRSQQIDMFTWRTAWGWAEGSFLSALKRVGQALETRVLVDRIFAEDRGALIAVCGDLNADAEEVEIKAIRGDVEDTGNGALAPFVLVPAERSVPEPARFSLYHHGRPNMLDHILVSRSLLAGYRQTEIHNELLHDESVAFAGDVKFPEPDHAPVIAEFSFDD